MKMHHVGIACSPIESGIRFVENNFVVIKKTDIIFDKVQNVDLCLLTLEDDSNIELVSGTTVEKFIKKRQLKFNYMMVI